MKAILISIQPKWCEIIVHDSYIRADAYGAVKKLEIRKTKPNVKLPIEVYIYCCEPHSNGKVFAKFTLNEILDIDYSTIKNDYDYVPLTGLYKKDIVKYANGNPLFGWKIDNLIIFDKPKELKEFKTLPCEKPERACQNCKFLVVTDNWMNGREMDCYVEDGKYITRPPQSWQYVQNND